MHPTQITIRLRDDGPLVIEGEVRVVDAEGRELLPQKRKPVLALCRCGHSADKPFCDGAHKQCGFASAPRAAE